MLNKQEIRSLIEVFGEACRFISELRARSPIAKLVQYPKTPTLLSESLAVHAIQEGRLLAAAGPFTTVQRGGRRADILADRADGRQLNIETKASGVQDFATFGGKDYAADFLLWFRFDTLLRDNHLGQVEVLVCPCPGNHLPSFHFENGKKRDRVTVNQLTQAWDGELVREYVDLQQLLGAA